MSLYPGAPAPLFTAPSPSNPTFALSSVGGRYVLLAFLPPPGPARQAAIALIREHRGIFGDNRVMFFGVLPDAASFAVAKDSPPFRWFSDGDGKLRALYVAAADGAVKPCWVLIDPSLRLLNVAPLAKGEEMMALLHRLPAPDRHAGVPMHAPVLVVPRIFEPPLCARLIESYARIGGGESGVMRQRDGKTVGVLSGFKKRKDATITDPALRAQLVGRITKRLFPEVAKAFQYTATRIERYIVACYDAVDGGHFQPHRDNTTAATAHRKFAVSINLNADAFDGGDLRFPEFGRNVYRPPTGGAVVFSCSLLHEVTPITRGTRYAFLPFLYDGEAAELRAANKHLLVTGPPQSDVL